MSTTPRLAQTFCLAMSLVSAAFVSAARSEQEQAAKYAESASRVGAPVPLTAEQMRAIQAKRAADPGAWVAPAPAGRPEKLAGVPPSAPARVSPSAAASSGVVPAKPNARADQPPTSLASWRSVAARLGPIPRPEWSAPWMTRKPADVTVSRPRNPADATSRAPVPETTGGER